MFCCLLITTFLCASQIVPSALAQVPAEATGRIVNGTTGQPMASFEFYLMAAGAQGMELVQTLRSDSQGNFKLAGLEKLLASPHLLQAEYRGVNYSHMLRSSGKLTDIELTVYETTDSMEGIKVSLPHMMIRREADLLRVDEIYQLENHARKSFVSKDGFRFSLPKNITRPVGVSVTAAGSTMPIQQTAAKNPDGSGYSINNPVKPGRTQIHISYEMSYAGESARLVKKSFYPLELFNLLLSPEDIKVSSNLLKDSSTESTGFRTLSAAPVPAQFEVSIELSGGSSRPPDPPAGTGMRQESAQEAGNQVTLFPPHIERYRVLIIVNLAILLAAFVGWRLTSRDGSPGRIVERVSRIGGSRGKLLKQRESLLEQIAQLDDQWDGKAIAEVDFRKRRQSLKSQLRDITFALESDHRTSRREP